MAKKSSTISIGYIGLMIVLALVFLGGIYFIYAYSFESIPTSTAESWLITDSQSLLMISENSRPMIRSN